MKAWLGTGRKAELLLDTRAGRLGLVGRSHSLDLPLTDMQAVSLRFIRNPRSIKNENSHPYVPLLGVLDGDGREHPLHAFGPDDDARVIALRAGQLLAKLTDRPLVTKRGGFFEEKAGTGEALPIEPDWPGREDKAYKGLT
jgi:hypothetical protein